MGKCNGSNFFIEIFRSLFAKKTSCVDKQEATACNNCLNVYQNHYQAVVSSVLTLILPECMYLRSDLRLVFETQ